jgi:hypothetical protein
MPKNRHVFHEARYEILDHVCRHCLGRIVYDPWRNLVKCVRCGVEFNGEVEGLCMCGVKAGKFNQLLVCVKNPNKSPTSPNEIVAMEAEAEAVMPTAKADKIPDVFGAD